MEEIHKLRMSDEFNINISSKTENGIVGTKVEVITKEKHTHRNLVDIFEVIDKSTLNENVKSKAKNIYGNWRSRSKSSWNYNRQDTFS